MYERSTGQTLRDLEILEAQAASLRRQVFDAEVEVEMLRARLAREQAECDDQARIVMKYSKDLALEITLSDKLKMALEAYIAASPSEPSAEVSEALDAWKRRRA